MRSVGNAHPKIFFGCPPGQEQQSLRCRTNSRTINGERPKYYVENNPPVITVSATIGRVQVVYFTIYPLNLDVKYFIYYVFECIYSKFETK